MAKEAYYFSHDSNARNDEKILMLMAEHGLEGYGAYWVLVEMMFESADTCLRHDKVKGIAFANSIAMAKLQEIIDTAITEELFVSDGTVFWSESLRRRKGRYNDLKEKRAEAGRIGAAKRWENHGKHGKAMAKPKQTESTPIAKNSKGKESKGKETKVKESKINYAEFVSLTEEEHQKLIDKHGEQKTKRMIEVLDNYKGANGKKYKSDYRAILSWVIDRVEKEKPQSRGDPNKINKKTDFQKFEQHSYTEDELDRLFEKMD